MVNEFSEVRSMKLIHVFKRLEGFVKLQEYPVGSNKCPELGSNCHQTPGH